MSLVIHLLGRPSLERDSGEAYQFRSRKSWAVLAYLILSEHSPTRSQLAALLFAEADDPLRALRWNLSEIRRGLGEEGSIDGDPVVLRLPPGTIVDVSQLTSGSWNTAVDLPGLGTELLEGLTVRDGAAFESWLLSQQRLVAATSEAILHEAALGSLSQGALYTAIGYAVRAAAMSPLDENHQALLIRLYRLAGDDVAAERQFAACRSMLTTQLAIAPGPAIEAAMRETRLTREGPVDAVSIQAMVEAGSAAVSAGAVEAGVHSLRIAVRMADRADVASLRTSSRLVLAEALVHSLRGLDEEGLATLHAADAIALANHDHETVSRARAEIGYVDFLRARYNRAVLWLTEGLEFAAGSPSITAKLTTYLGSVESDRADYARATTLLEDAIRLSRVVGDNRREAFARSMLGRVHLLRSDLDSAADQLDISIELAEQDHWLAVLPWPQALRGEVQLARADVSGAAELLQQAFARACRLGDPCWEAMAARGLALLAETNGETDRAFETLADARVRCNRLADPYVWLDGYILDAQCELGRRHDHPETRLWVDTMRELASRTGMRELTVRSLLHSAALGHQGDRAAAAMLAHDIDNPLLDRLLATSTAGAGSQTNRSDGQRDEHHSRNTTRPSRTNPSTPAPPPFRPTGLRRT